MAAKWERRELNPRGQKTTPVLQTGTTLPTVDIRPDRFNGITALRSVILPQESGSREPNRDGRDRTCDILLPKQARYRCATSRKGPNLTHETSQGRTEVGAKLSAGLANWPVRLVTSVVPTARQPSRKHHTLTTECVAVSGTCRRIPYDSGV